MKKALLAFALVIIGLSLSPKAHAQTLSCTNSNHCDQLTWTASSDAAANPTLGYQIYRFVGTCPTTTPTSVSAATGFVLISGTTPLTGLTYTDNGFPLSPLAPGMYCYFGVSSLNGAQSVPSNLVQAVILPAPPTNFAGTSK